MECNRGGVGEKDETVLSYTAEKTVHSLPIGHYVRHTAARLSSPAIPGGPQDGNNGSRPRVPTFIEFPHTRTYTYTQQYKHCIWGLNGGSHQRTVLIRGLESVLVTDRWTVLEAAGIAITEMDTNTPARGKRYHSWSPLFCSALFLFR